MHDRVGRPADRAVHADCVLEGRAGENFRHAKILLNRLDDTPPGHVGKRRAPRIGSWYGGISRQTHADRLDHARHRGRRSHGHTVPGAARHRGFGVEKVLELHLASANILAEGPDVGPRADVAPTKLSVQHWAARNHDGWQVAARRAHHEGRGRFVAPREQDHAVERVGPDGLFDVHADEVAEEHRGRPH